MYKLNRKLEYALMALRFMALKRQGQLSTVKEICAQTGAPFDATARVMQQLASEGVLKSEHGVQGGYLIARDLKKYSFYELAEAIEGPIGMVKCVRADDHCDLLASCNVRSPLNELNSRMSEFLKSLSLQDLLKPGTKIATHRGA